MFEIGAEGVLPVLGALSGAVLGFAARTSHFCPLSALERHWYGGDQTGLRALALAAATALFATQALAAAGLADLSASFYLEPSFGWIGAILGGVMFGFGMALVGTCGFGAAVRLGGGNLRALVVLLVLGLAALSTQRGLLAAVRVPLVDENTLDLSVLGDGSIGSLASHLLGIEAHLAIVAAIGLGLLAFVAADPAFLRQRAQVAAAIAIGLVIAFGWVVTTLVAAHAFHPVEVEAGSFVVPVGDVILHLIARTGALPDYGAGLVVGTVAGSAMASWWRHDVRWEACDDARELGRHVAGGILMGVGGVFALGCTIGQGLSAFSALAISAPVVMVSIALGARLGLGWLVEGAPFVSLRRRGQPGRP